MQFCEWSSRIDPWRAGERVVSGRAQGERILIILIKPHLLIRTVNSRPHPSSVILLWDFFIKNKSNVTRFSKNAYSSVAPNSPRYKIKKHSETLTKYNRPNDWNLHETF